MFYFLCSIISGTAVILMKILQNFSMNRNPLLYLTVLLVIMGMMFVLLGILAELLIRIYHESQDKPPYSVKDVINL